MVEFTFFEIHLDDAEFTANAPFSSADAEDAEGLEDVDVDVGDVAGEGSGGPNPAGLVVGLLALVAVVVVLRKVMGGSDEAEE